LQSTPCTTFALAGVNVVDLPAPSKVALGSILICAATAAEFTH